MSRSCDDELAEPAKSLSALGSNAKVDPMVPFHEPLIRNPYKNHLTPLNITYERGAHIADPLKKVGAHTRGPSEIPCTNVQPTAPLTRELF